jgi:hypothetical protein
MKNFGYELDYDLGIPLRNDLVVMMICCNLDSS